ncbi:reprolysin-like metallopeptidase [Flavobacterium sp.]|uniref:reprolysin-like metallopeptidase n=1 Tax=Flavobacterium sp. TaxID=239 RepID=UPI003B98F3C9
MKRILLIVLLLSILLPNEASSQIWTRISKADVASKPRLEFKNFPSNYETFDLNTAALKAVLVGAPDRKTAGSQAGKLISFPSPNGELVEYEVYEASVMHPSLAAKYPDIKSYVGRSTKNKNSSIRFSVTLFGLHSINFDTEVGTYYIQPLSADLGTYLVYNRTSLENLSGFNCEVMDEVSAVEAEAFSTQATNSDSGILRTYRLAISCTIEYAAYHVAAAGLNNGTNAQKVAAVLAAMNVTMTRVNGLYERDAAITMELIGNNDTLINIASDNFNNTNGGQLLQQNQTFIDNNIGSANYDIGHVFSTGGGGIASLGSVCLAGQKARGVTGSDAPVGDPFDIDYVAHEMGHQFGATHTFSSQTGSCNGNMSPSTSVEPGSGTTIMSYAGICAPQNVQNNSDAAFHAVSLAQIDALVSSSASCSVNTAMSNAAPVIQPVSDYTIPFSTPFLLRGFATDVDDAGLTYCWEQIDTDTSIQPPAATSEVGPNFRSRIPVNVGTRFFPQFTSVFGNNITPTYEVVASVERSYNFALTVRDNDLVNGGQTARENITVNVANTGPFTVTSPNTNTSLVAGSNQVVTWDVAGTTGNGVDTPFVDIWLLTTSSNPFGTLVASKVPNDGSETISLPSTTGSTNRVLIIGHNNIFYDISNANFAITTGGSSFSIGMNGVAGEQNKPICAGSQTTFPISYVAFGGFNAQTTLSATNLPAGINVSFSQNTINATGTVTMTVSSGANMTAGVYAITVTATSGNISKTATFYVEVSTANFATSTLSTPANNATGVNTATTLTWLADPGATNYDIQIAQDSNFSTIVATGNVTTNTFAASDLPSLTELFWRIRPRNSGCIGNWSTAFKFTTKYCDNYVSVNVPLTISATGQPTINSTLSVPAAENITINELEVYVKINHTWVRDLTCRLISPTGTNIRLFQAVCTNTEGNENVDATFTASGSAIICQPQNPRISGRNIPLDGFTNIIGQNSQGTWTLRVTDSTNGDGGALVAWSLRLCGAAAPLSVEDTTSDFGIAIYPNPSNGNFTISSAKALDAKSEITVYDMRGRVLHQSNTAGAGPLNEIISLQNAQAGVYLVSISGANFKEVKRIVVE